MHALFLGYLQGFRKVSMVKLADCNTESADCTTDSIIVSQRPMLKMFDICQPIKLANRNLLIIVISHQQICHAGMGTLPPAGSEEHEVLQIGSIHVAILPSFRYYPKKF